MLPVQVVGMTMEHLDGIVEVENLCFSIPWSRNAFIEEITVNKLAIYLAALSGDMVVGYAGMWKVFDEGHITNIAVHPQYRRNGVGSLLLNEMLKAAKAGGIAALTLEVRKSNAAAIGLYGKYGFVEQGIRKAYYADNGEDAIIMWKK